MACKSNIRSIYVSVIVSDALISYSVTITIVIRMAYSISIWKRPNLAAVIIWANVEVDVAIACGS